MTMSTGRKAWRDTDGFHGGVGPLYEATEITARARRAYRVTSHPQMGMSGKKARVTAESRPMNERESMSTGFSSRRMHGYTIPVNKMQVERSPSIMVGSNPFA